MSTLKSHSPAVWALHYFDLSPVTKPCDQGKLENYVTLVDVQPTGIGRMEHKMGLYSGQDANARAPSPEQREILPRKLLGHTHTPQKMDFIPRYGIPVSRTRQSELCLHKMLLPQPFGTLHIQKKRSCTFCQKLGKFSLVKFTFFSIYIDLSHKMWC